MNHHPGTIGILMVFFLSIVHIGYFRVIFGAPYIGEKTPHIRLKFAVSRLCTESGIKAATGMYDALRIRKIFDLFYGTSANRMTHNLQNTMASFKT